MFGNSYYILGSKIAGRAPYVIDILQLLLNEKSDIIMAKSNHSLCICTKCIYSIGEDNIIHGV